MQVTSPLTAEALRRGGAVQLDGHAAQLAATVKRRRWQRTPVQPLILEAFGQAGVELRTLLAQRGARERATAGLWQLVQTQLQRYNARQVLAAMGRHHAWDAPLQPVVPV